MAELLLAQPTIDVGDCALRAAETGDTRMLLMLLERLRAQGTGREMAGCAGSPDYPDGTTPLLLAAQNGHYDAIALLLARGHTLRRPHGPGCRCKSCGPQKHIQDPVALGAARLALYKAWVSPAFLCHSCDDPVLEAFLLCKELRRWAVETPTLRPAFAELALRARLFAAELLGCCRTAFEVSVLLRRRSGCSLPQEVTFPRLMLAVDLNQKEFVAHPNAQQVLQTAWAGDWSEWQSRSVTFKALSVIPRALLLPLVAAVAIFAPRCTLGRHYALPVNKYLSHCASYLIFLVLVFLQSNLDRHLLERGPPHSGLEPFIILFVVGHIWGSTRLCLIRGPRRYFTVLRNWYDAVTQFLFVAAFLFWLAAAFDVSANGLKNLERKYWHALDPTLIAEGFFALAAILAFGRMLLLLQFSFHLGPLQVSLGKMFKDIAKFLAIFLIVLFSFAAGLCRFYQYYDGMSQHDPWGGTIAQLSSFVSLPHTLKTLFWCLFCMSPLEAADVVIENLPGEGGTTIVNSHYFTEAVGHLCFALFMVFCVIVLLNMLIATICNTFQKVTENVDVEWTFGRTEVYLVYLSQTTLPPPLNLLPTAGALAAVGRWFSLLGESRDKVCDGGRARWSLDHCCYIEEAAPTEDQQRDYAAVLAQLAQRYFREHEGMPPNAPLPSPFAHDRSTSRFTGFGPAANDLEALRREVAGLRDALLYALGPDPCPAMRLQNGDSDSHTAPHLAIYASPQTSTVTEDSPSPPMASSYDPAPSSSRRRRRRSTLRPSPRSSKLRPSPRPSDPHSLPLSPIPSAISTPGSPTISPLVSPMVSPVPSPTTGKLSYDYPVAAASIHSPHMSQRRMTQVTFHSRSLLPSPPESPLGSLSPSRFPSQRSASATASASRRSSRRSFRRLSGRRPTETPHLVTKMAQMAVNQAVMDGAAVAHAAMSATRILGSPSPQRHVARTVGILRPCPGSTSVSSDAVP